MDHFKWKFMLQICIIMGAHTRSGPASPSYQSQDDEPALIVNKCERNGQQSD